MPIDYAADFAEMLDEDEHATAVTYTSLVGTISNINVIIDSGVTRIGFDSEISTTHDECTFLNVDITSPKRGDKVVYGSITLNFVSEIENDGIISSWLVKNG